MKGELLISSVALVVLFGDTLSVIFPSISSNTFKAIGFLMYVPFPSLVPIPTSHIPSFHQTLTLSVLPTTLLPLHLLSLPSLLSTLSSLLLIIVLILDGSLAGQILHPQPTNLGPEWHNANWLGGVGLVLAGFGGHAVVPGLARDMKHPECFDRVINRAFVSSIQSASDWVVGGG